MDSVPVGSPLSSFLYFHFWRKTKFLLCLCRIAHPVGVAYLPHLVGIDNTAPRHLLGQRTKKGHDKLRNPQLYRTALQRLGDGGDEIIRGINTAIGHKKDLVFSFLFLRREYYTIYKVVNV